MSTSEDRPTAPGSALLDVVAVMDRLRSPGGCPWDAEQTHASLTRYLLEETYEVIDAVEDLDGTPGTEAELAEELGDVLLQVVFHARVAADRGAFDVDDVARALAAKLRRRHPHVFGDGTTGRDDLRERDDADPPDAPDAPGTGEAVQARWDALKQAEKPHRGPVDGIPRHLPALARADKLLSRLERAGLPLPVGPGTPPAPTSAESVGDELLALVVRARAAGVDAEAALRERVRSVESAVAGSAARPR